MSFVEALDREYKTLLDKLNDEISQFTSVLAMVFDGAMNERFEASIAIAIAAGADRKRILKDSNERDAFFSSN